MSGPAPDEWKYVLWEVRVPERHECMVRMTKSTCKKPATSYYLGESGEFYRCGKHTRILLRQRPDFSLIHNPLR